MDYCFLSIVVQCQENKNLKLKLNLSEVRSMLRLRMGLLANFLTYVHKFLFILLEVLDFVKNMAI